jgi:hypothetical protein
MAEATRTAATTAMTMPAIAPEERPELEAPWSGEEAAEMVPISSVSLPFLLLPLELELEEEADLLAPVLLELELPEGLDA